MAASSKLSLKLLIDQTTNRVLFAEAGKETIDFLFSILTLPVSTVVRLLSKQGMLGCLANLYGSIENLNVEYLQPNQNKDNILLKPNTASQEIPNLFMLGNTAPRNSQFYVCSKTSSFPSTLLHYYVTENPQTICPSCGYIMNREVTPVGDHTREVETAVEGATTVGFVKGVVMYIVMDDLSVKPMSTISSIGLLKKLNVKDVKALRERVVHLDIDKGLKLLKTAFQSKEVLTSVFILQDEVPTGTCEKKRRVSRR